MRINERCSCGFAYQRKRKREREREKERKREIREWGSAICRLHNGALSAFAFLSLPLSATRLPWRSTYSFLTVALRAGIEHEDMAAGGGETSASASTGEAAPEERPAAFKSRRGREHGVGRGWQSAAGLRRKLQAGEREREVW